MNSIKELLLIDRPERPEPWQKNMAAIVISTLMIAKFFFSGRGGSDGLFIVLGIWFLLIFYPRHWGTLLQLGVWLVLTALHWISLLALVLIFYFAFLPMGAWKRRKGWDPMRWKLDSATPSYREPAEELRENHFLKPF